MLSYCFVGKYVFSFHCLFHSWLTTQGECLIESQTCTNSHANINVFPPSSPPYLPPSLPPSSFLLPPSLLLLPPPSFLLPHSLLHTGFYVQPDVLFFSEHPSSQLLVANSDLYLSCAVQLRSISDEEGGLTAPVVEWRVNGTSVLEVCPLPAPTHGSNPEQWHRKSFIRESTSSICSLDEEAWLCVLEVWQSYV